MHLHFRPTHLYFRLNVCYPHRVYHPSFAVYLKYIISLNTYFKKIKLEEPLAQPLSFYR